MKIAKILIFFENTYLYIAYADDTKFFLRDARSLNNLRNMVNIFSSFCGLKPVLSKCELAVIGSPKGTKKAIWGIKSTDLKQ